MFVFPNLQVKLKPQKYALCLSCGFQTPRGCSGVRSTAIHSTTSKTEACNPSPTDVNVKSQFPTVVLQRKPLLQAPLHASTACCSFLPKHSSHLHLLDQCLSASEDSKFHNVGILCIGYFCISSTQLNTQETVTPNTFLLIIVDSFYLQHLFIQSEQEIRELKYSLLHHYGARVGTCWRFKRCHFNSAHRPDLFCSPRQRKY